MFFRLSSLELGVIIFGIVLGTTLVGAFLGSRLRGHADTLREPFGIVQAALLGLVALILAFGLTMAVGRYDQRRAAVVDDANAIGTTYLRAQTLREPLRTESLDLLVRYTDASIALSNSVPRSAAQAAAIADEEELQRSLWRLGAEALADSPTDSAPRLYIETLNEMIDMQTVRVSALNNRVPEACLRSRSSVRQSASAFSASTLRSSRTAWSWSSWPRRSSRLFSSSRLTSIANAGARNGARHATRRSASGNGASAGSGRAERSLARFTAMTSRW